METLSLLHTVYGGILSQAPPLPGGSLPLSPSHVSITLVAKQPTLPT